MGRCLSVLLFTIYGAVLLTASGAVVAGDSSPRVEAFIDRHWQRPLAAQGDPPAGFTAFERSLDPLTCGGCHQQQLLDWRGSLHAHAMGPGLLGQLLQMQADDRIGHQACLRCHAPLAEQADEVVALLEDPAAIQKVSQGVASDNQLYSQGLICAACHLRNRVVYGPPRRDGSHVTSDGPHNGFKESGAFEDALFCAACHQFEADGYALNGKLLENTFEEWRSSPQAQAGQSCQSCHMPDRRHLWRGIHDKATVLAGVTIELEQLVATREHAAGRLSLTNSATGHRFPTYVTPRVVMEAVQLDASGGPIAETRQAQIVARQVSLDLRTELFDTRLAPGASANLTYSEPVDPNAISLQFTIRVEPDRFYREFYRSRLQDDVNEASAEHLHQALDAAEASVYTLFQRVIPLYQ